MIWPTASVEILLTRTSGEKALYNAGLLRITIWDDNVMYSPNADLMRYHERERLVQVDVELSDSSKTPESQ